jgi:glycerol-3-phosphate dehydrogenase
MTESPKDVLVVGGGIQGVGVAQAAAAARHSVLLLESHTIAAGTSSRSSKLIHGGLRYLESKQFGLVRESLKEREILLKIAPHLVKLVPFYLPVYRTTTRSPWTMRLGLSLYSLLGGLGKSTRFKTVPEREWHTLDRILPSGLLRVFQYSDGQTDDAALCRAVLRSAREMGADVALPAEFLSAAREADMWRVKYRVEGEQREVLARVLINAAGPWVNGVLDRVTAEWGSTPPRREIDLVAGTHIELEGEVTRGIYYVEAPSDQRAVFVIPWKGHTLVGTTEQPFEGDPRKVAPTPEEIEYLESTLHHYFPEHTGKRTDAWSGLRVLPRGEGKAFHRPREVILMPDDAKAPTLVSIYGGKLTGYRHTAQRVMKLLQRTLPQHTLLADTAKLRLPDPDSPGPEADSWLREAAARS